MTRAPFALLLLAASSALAAEPLRFERIVIDDAFPGGYQVEVADVNGDRKPDIVALGGSTLAWYENPTWKKRLIIDRLFTPDIISSATADLDGDGKAEIAVAYDFSMNEPKRGKLLLAIQTGTPDDPWTFAKVADVPSIHRLRWGDLDGDGKLDLVVAPIFGPESVPPAFDQNEATLRIYVPDRSNPLGGRWWTKVVAHRPVMHAIEVVPSPEAGRTGPDRVRVASNDRVLMASNAGVGVAWLFPQAVRDTFDRDLIPGAPGTSPKKGSSEVHLGKLADGRRFLATIDPWHGKEVAVCVAEKPGQLADFGPRAVLDDTLDDGHALWVADVDGDGNDEVFAGHRGNDARVSAYRFDGKAWTRTVLDPGLTAQDLRGGDLDGDGTPDVVAIGGKSHNVVWFRPVKTAGR